MTKYWFKPKTYGYGFVPITREGRVATLVFVGVILLVAYVNGFFDQTVAEKDQLWAVINFLFNIIILSVLFTLLFKNKIKGGLKWRWGNKKDNKNN